MMDTEKGSSFSADAENSCEAIKKTPPAGDAAHSCNCACNLEEALGFGKPCLKVFGQASVMYCKGT